MNFSFGSVKLFHRLLYGEAVRQNFVDDIFKVEDVGSIPQKVMTVFSTCANPDRCLIVKFQIVEEVTFTEYIFEFVRFKNIIRFDQVNRLKGEREANSV